MKIAGVDFPEQLLNALRDGRLVVFAGAGVSMGAPAHLPSFRRLAEKVADGTGQFIGNDEPEDRFLGRLKDRGTDVHRIAADVLQPDASKPTELHRNLLRLYGAPDDVRIVTTNFDLLFEQSAAALFHSDPQLFQGPALPVGSRFQGIVHLHGSVANPKEMVLTHRDFGRAYLTESDGWARRFLVDLFTNYTVLFVGYSHSDTIMTYLTPALPPDAAQRRFALIGDQSDQPERWQRLGIQPIVFHQENDNDFRRLDDAIKGLADYVRRGILDWQQEISAIAGGHPPIDDESAAIIEHALANPDLTRFFVEAATLPEWLDWLERRKRLDALFREEKLNQTDRQLSFWLTRNFAIRYCDRVFSLIERHSEMVNPRLWVSLCHCLSQKNDVELDASTLTKWVHFLMISVPPYSHSLHVDMRLHRLAEACADHGALQSLLLVYDAITARQNPVRYSSAEQTYSGQRDLMNQHNMQILWQNCLQPHLPEVAYSLLERTTMRLEERHALMQAWGYAEGHYGTDSYRRTAIELHSQDEYPKCSSGIDALINVARDCLEWMAANDPRYISNWCDRFVGSTAPLLRRLAIHAVSARRDLSDDDKIAWLLQRCDVNEAVARHEIFRAAATAYPQTGAHQRTALITAISEYQAPETGYDDPLPRLSAYHHFRWFHWLTTAAPDCAIAKAALDGVWGQYPEFAPTEHPGPNLWTHASPWVEIAQTLLEKSAVEALPDLLEALQTAEPHERGDILTAVSKAAQENLSWGLNLADALAESGTWDSELWRSLINAWATEEIDEDNAERLLSHLSVGKMHHHYPHEIANALRNLAQNAKDTDPIEWLEQANQIATALRQHVAEQERPAITIYAGGSPQYVSWLDRAINHASGQLALFWVNSIRLWKRQNPDSQALNGTYRSALDDIVRETGVSGQFGRTVLASRLHFFLAVDETWTLDRLLPLFDADHEDFQCAWDGFLVWGRLFPLTAEHIRASMIKALPKAVNTFDDRMIERFTHFYVEEIRLIIKDANDKLITEFVNRAGPKAKCQFAQEIWLRLEKLDETAQLEWWNGWLKDYWRNRLKGVPVGLDAGEVDYMLAWPPCLPGAFPEAVDLAIRMLSTINDDFSMSDNVPLNLIKNSDKNSDLLNRYPTEVACFIIRLDRFASEPFMWWLSAQEVVDTLLTKQLPEDVERGLRELKAKYGPL